LLCERTAADTNQKRLVRSGLRLMVVHARLAEAG
jgi:hypothetical protein